MIRRKLVVLAGCLFGVVLTGIAQLNQDLYKDAVPSALMKNKELSQADLEGLVRYYRMKAKDEKKAAELESLLLQQNPKGPFARFVSFQRLGSIRDSKARIAAIEAFLANFPKSEWNNNPRNHEFIITVCTG